MIAPSDLTQAALADLLEYRPETGQFVWVKPRRAVRVGREAGSINSKGYRNLKVAGHLYSAHRLAWFYVHGVWPEQIDHINGDKDDNRIANLRDCTQAENGQNLAINSRNKVGIPGVFFNNTRNRWQASIQVNGKPRYLGRYKTAEEAGVAYAQAKAKLHTFQPTVRGASA